MCQQSVWFMSLHVLGPEGTNYKLDLKIPIVLCLIYIQTPPTIQISIPTSTHFSHLMTKLSIVVTSTSLLLTGALSGTSLYSTTFCDLIYKFNLSQHISHPTHVRGNILDLILSNDINLVCNISISSSNFPTPTSDHYKINFSISSATPPKPKSRTSYILNSSKADWSGLTQFLLDYDFIHLYSAPTSTPSGLNSNKQFWTQPPYSSPKSNSSPLQIHP